MTSTLHSDKTRSEIDKIDAIVYEDKKKAELDGERIRQTGVMWHGVVVSQNQTVGRPDQADGRERRERGPARMIGQVAVRRDI